jgi:hypothetical protein
MSLATRKINEQQRGHSKSQQIWNKLLNFLIILLYFLIIKHFVCITIMLHIYDINFNECLLYIHVVYKNAYISHILGSITTGYSKKKIIAWVQKILI